MWVALQLLARDFGAARRVYEGVYVEVAEVNLGASRMATKSRKRVGKHGMRVGEEIIKEVVL